MSNAGYTAEARARREARQAGHIALPTLTRDQLLVEARKRGKALAEKERIIKALLAQVDDHETETAALRATLDGVIRQLDGIEERVGAMDGKQTPRGTE